MGSLAAGDPRENTRPAAGRLFGRGRRTRPIHERLRRQAEALRSQTVQGRYRQGHAVGLVGGSIEEVVTAIHNDALRIGSKRCGGPGPVRVQRWASRDHANTSRMGSRADQSVGVLHHQAAARMRSRGKRLRTHERGSRSDLGRAGRSTPFRGRATWAEVTSRAGGKHSTRR